MENLIDIPGRLHSVAVEKHVAGTDQIYDDFLKTTLDILNLENITDVKVQDGKLLFLNIQGLVLKEISIASEQKQSDWNLTDSTQVDFIKSKPIIYNKLEVDDKLITKQDTISDLVTIRSGAQAGATAYQKPATGIPATDLASAVQVSLSKADTALQEHQSLAGLVNTGSYNTVSKKIELKHDNTVLAEIDATAFIKDGMVSSVTISNGYLVITFNTDAGKEPISIALTDIFNPANYYDKDDVDGLLAAKVNTADLARVATSGSYNDLSDQPTLDDLNKVEDLYALDATNSDWKRKVDKMFDDGTLPTMSKSFDYCNLRIYKKYTSGVEADTTAINSLETTEEGLTFADGTHFSSYKIGAKYYVGYLTSFGINNESTVLGNIEITCTKSGILKLYLYKCAITEDAYFQINGQPTDVEMPTTDAATILSFDVNEGDVISVSPTKHMDALHYYDFGLVGMSFYSKYPVSRFANDAGYLTQHQDISGKANKNEMSVVQGTGADADKTTITLKQGTSATVLTAHQDISGKEDTSNKVTSWQATPDDTHYPSEKLVKDGIDAVDKVFWATRGTTTYTEIVAAFLNGKLVVCSYGDNIYYLERLQSNQNAMFYSLIGGEGNFMRCTPTNQWSSWYVNLESLSNKKTTITGNEASDTYYPSTKAVADYAEKKTDIVAPVNTTDATLPITTLTCEVGKYYRIDVAVDTLGVTLPAMTDLTTARTVVIYLTAVTTHAVAISAADNKDVYYQDGFDIEAGNTYEINALFNGAAWIVAAVKINVE